MKKIIIPLLLILITAALSADVLVGKVVRVKDGDTLVILDSSKQQHAIRLTHIDTPESGQPFGQKSKQVLIQLCAGKMVEVHHDNKTTYDRLLGEIFLEGQSLNLAMTQLGYAWHYKQYSKDKRYAQAHAFAKENKKGLWIDPNPIPPWEWRKRSRK